MTHLLLPEWTLPSESTVPCLLRATTYNLQTILRSCLAFIRTLASQKAFLHSWSIHFYLFLPVSGLGTSSSKLSCESLGVPVVSQSWTAGLFPAPLGFPLGETSIRSQHNVILLCTADLSSPQGPPKGPWGLLFRAGWKLASNLSSSHTWTHQEM